MDRGEWDSAIQHCQQAIEAWPTYYDAWLLMAGAWEEKGDFSNALQAVERASEIAIVELSQAWNNLASLHVIRQEWEDALTIDRVLGLIDPMRHAIIRYRMAVCHAQLGDAETAYRWLSEAMQRRPELRERALQEPWLAALHDRLRA
jgi:tetratricopeptide (TPR) repeat protein